MTWRLRLHLPGEKWFHLPVGGSIDSARIDAQVDERIRREPSLGPSRQKLIRMLTHFAHDATKPGVVAAAVLWALDQVDSAIFGRLYVSVHEPLAPGTVDGELAARQAEMEQLQADPRSSMERRDLALGPALRVRMLTNLPEAPVQPVREPPVNSDEDDGMSTGHAQRLVVEDMVQYWVPLPDYGVTLAFTFSTPNLVAADPLITHLDGVASHFTIEVVEDV